MEWAGWSLLRKGEALATQWAALHLWGPGSGMRTGEWGPAQLVGGPFLGAEPPGRVGRRVLGARTGGLGEGGIKQGAGK